MFKLVGIGVVLAGFLARLNPLLVVVAAALATGLAAGLDPVTVVAALGKAFNDNRYISLVWLVLPVIGLLERYGLQARARTLIGRIARATPGRLLIVYLAVRQGTAALGLTSLGGHAQMVRPLIAPMTEAAAERAGRPASEALRARLRALAAATDNVGVFFGEDIFVAMSSILLIKGFFEANHINLQPLQLSVWAIPTAVCAFAIHAGRLLLLDARLQSEADRGAAVKADAQDAKAQEGEQA